VAVSSDGTTVVSGSEDKSVREFDASSGEEPNRCCHGKVVVGPCCHPLWPAVVSVHPLNRLGGGGCRIYKLF
jgi:WD40 repeat protein